MKKIVLTVALLASLAALPAWADEIVATVAGEPITLEALEKHVRPQLIEIDNQRYEVLEGGLQSLIAQRLIEKEAAARGVSAEQLRGEEIDAKITKPTDADITELYEANKAQLGEATLEELKPRIAAYITQQRQGERAQVFLDELAKKYPTEIKLAAPSVEVSSGTGIPRGGGTDAPVTIIAFSDYECPYCQRAEQTVAQVLEVYGDKIRYYHRDYPLPFHAHAKPAAMAARCAGDQGKFWEYHDKLFSTRELSEENLKGHATALELDRTKFDDCLASGKYSDTIDKDLEDGANVGVSGTPAFFINGRMLSGAQPLDRFKAVIDAELARSEGGSAKN